MMFEKVSKKKKVRKDDIIIRFRGLGILSIIILLSFILMLSLFNIQTVLAQEVSYCCEKTKTGAWCQNAPEEACDENFRRTPTSCDATSFCRLGCCYDSEEGTCMENTPQKVCEENEGAWEASSECEIPQCGLGCCNMGDQAAFVTQTRCTRLSALYGLETNFRRDIQNEIECIASAGAEVKGACVFEEDFEKTCKFVTKKECLDMGASLTSVGGESEVSFHEGFLCSADELGTNCGKSKKTKCIEGRDEVYFIDTCGNIANIYDASKVNDPAYWRKVVKKQNSCGYGDGNANSKTCGNCDYFLGSTCKKYDRSEDKNNANYGDYVCRDLSCEYEGETYEHGETWCVDAKGIEESLPGSRHFRLVCYNGDVTVEPCADFRQEICLQTEVNDFKNAACRPNKWQDCYSQIRKKDCENTDKRDCKWLEGEELSFVGEEAEDEKGKVKVKGACVPKYAPGFDFWQESEADSICGMATRECVVTYEKGFLSKEKCIDNCECLEDDWETNMNKLCINLGDCGVKKNYLGRMGYNEENED